MGGVDLYPPPPPVPLAADLLGRFTTIDICLDAEDDELDDVEASDCEERRDVFALGTVADGDSTL